MRTQRKMLEAGRDPRVPKVKEAKAKPTNLTMSLSRGEARAR